MFIKKNDSSPSPSQTDGKQTSYLTVGINHRPQQLPGAPPAVHPHHAQDLKEAEAAQRWGGKHVTLATGWNHSNRGDEDNDIWGVKEWKLNVIGSTVTGTLVDFLLFCAIKQKKSHLWKTVLFSPAVTHEYGNPHPPPTYQWHRRASWQSGGVPANLDSGSSSQRSISWRCTPGQKPRSSQTPAWYTHNHMVQHRRTLCPYQDKQRCK